MNKQVFLDRLCQGLSGLPRDDIEERIAFYSEMIDDRMEEGLSEEEAVSEIGSLDGIISQSIADVPLKKLVKENMTSKGKLKPWEITLLILGFPLWFPLLISAFAVILSLYAALWSLIISLWAIFGSVAACGFSGIISGVGFTFYGNRLAGIAMIGLGIVCAGLAIFLFWGCKAGTDGTVLLTKNIARSVKSHFLKRRTQNG